MQKILFLTLIISCIGYITCTFLQPNALFAVPPAIKFFCANPNLISDNRLACHDSDELLKIDDAIFGQIDIDLCPPVGKQSFVTTAICDESFTTKLVVKQLCENKQSCVIDIAKSGIPVACPFHNTSSPRSQGGQYLKIEYRCSGNRIRFHPFAGNSLGGKIGQKRLRNK